MPRLVLRHTDLGPVDGGPTNLQLNIDSQLGLFSGEIEEDGAFTVFNFPATNFTTTFQSATEATVSGSGMSAPVGATGGATACTASLSFDSAAQTLSGTLSLKGVAISLSEHPTHASIVIFP